MQNHQKPEPRIHLIVQTLSGTFEDEFNVHQTLEHVVQRTFTKLHIKPAPGEVWELRLGDQVLNKQQTIEQAGVPDGAKLKLAPRESGGGA